MEEVIVIEPMSLRTLHFRTLVQSLDKGLWNLELCPSMTLHAAIANAERLVMIMAHYRKKKRDAIDAIDEVVCMDFLEVEDEE